VADDPVRLGGLTRVRIDTAFPNSLFGTRLDSTALPAHAASGGPA